MPPESLPFRTSNRSSLQTFNGEIATSQWEYEDYALANGRGQFASAEPDVLLEIPVLKVEKIDLRANDLRARLSVKAKLANLLKLSFGVGVYLDRVKLEIKGVEAQVLLKVKLENVLAILDQTLDTIDGNPEILKSLIQAADETVDSVGGVAREAVGKSGAVSQLTGGRGEATQQVDDAAGQAVGQAGQVANQAVGKATGQVGQVVDQAGQIIDNIVPVDNTVPGGRLLGETANGAGQTVQRTVDEPGSIVEHTLSECGEVLNEEVVGSILDLEEHSESQPETVEEEPDATEAAR